MLELRNLRTNYGKFEALHDISLTVRAGEAVALLGANAAGKSTTLKSISRIVRHVGGSIHYDGQNISAWTTRRVVEAGLIQVPEGRQAFPFMTVLENLELGSYAPAARRVRKESLEEVYALLPLLRERRKQYAGTLSGGEQQMLAIGRAIMARPRLLMLDEPSLGLAPLAVRAVFDLIVRLKAGGLTLLLVEQNAAQALKVVDRAYVLESGNVVMEGTPTDLLADGALRSAYLGLEVAP